MDDLSVNIGNFDHCVAMGVFGTQPNQVASVLLWSIVNNGLSIDFEMSGLSDGWVGFGISRNFAGIGQRMFFSDVIIGFRDPFNNNATIVDDFFIGTEQIYCNVGAKRGVCTDTVLGGQKNIRNTGLQFDAAKGVTHVQFTRDLNTGDAATDTIITQANQQFLWAFNSMSPAGVVDYHASNREAINMSLLNPPACPSTPAGVCNGVGTCVKGCCICPTDSGIDCAAQAGGAAAVPNVIDKTNFPFSAALDGTLTVNWNINNADGTIDIGLQCKGCTGWVAFGPSPQALMIGADAVLSWINPDGTLTTNDYFITERGISGIITDIQRGGTDDILGSFGENKNGVLTIIFRRKLVTGDKQFDVDYTAGQVGVVFAYNPTTPGPTLVQHLGTTRNPVKIDFFSGVVNIDATIDNLRKAHGAIMFVVWCVAIPVTSFIARYLKAQLGHAWFEIHRITNFIAMLMNVAAFAIAVYFVNGTPHFLLPHQIIGLIVFILGTVQPIIGTIADRLWTPEREKTPIFPDITHWIIGWVTLALALVNIGLGIFDYVFATSTALFVYIAIGGTVAVFLIVFAIFNKITGIPHSDH